MTSKLSWLSTVLVVVLVCQCVALSVHTWWIVERELQPPHLIKRLEKAVIASYPELKTTWLQETKERAPRVAQQWSHQIMARAPQARERLEAITRSRMEVGIDNAVEFSAEEFRQWLRDNHDAIEDVFQQVEQAPHDTRLLVLDTEASLEEQLGLDLRDQARLTLDLYRLLNDKLEQLTRPQSKLTHQEQLERRALRIVRALTHAEN